MIYALDFKTEGIVNEADIVRTYRGPIQDATRLVVTWLVLLQNLAINILKTLNTFGITACVRDIARQIRYHFAFVSPIFL